MILWTLGCYSSTVVRQQKMHVRQNRSSIFVLLDRPSPQIADVLPLSMSTPQRSMILGSSAQHHEETYRPPRQWEPLVPCTRQWGPLQIGCPQTDSASTPKKPNSSGWATGSSWQS